MSRTTIGTCCAAALVAALVAAAAPVALYTISLALFGLPHVVAELRYVDRRFGRRLGRHLALGLGVLLAIIALVRAASGLHLADGVTAVALELVLLAALVAVVLPVLAAGRPGRGAALVGGTLAIGLWLGSALAPVAVLVVLALLHNLTPLGFLAERLTGRDRRRVMATGVVLLVGLPALLATGAIGALLARSGLAFPSLSPLTSAAPELHLGAFVPAFLRDHPVALHLFTAGAYLQVMHYAAVLHVLPRLQRDAGPAESDGIIAWPRERVFTAILGALGAVSITFFALSFGDARTAYGVFAAVHAAVEWPVLVLALGAFFASDTARGPAVAAG